MSCLNNQGVQGCEPKKYTKYGYLLLTRCFACHCEPLHAGFPFTVTAHPQYLGAAMTAWGVCVLIANQTVVEKGLFALAGVQTLYYLYMSAVEAMCGAVC